jgi:hypothetical protein
MHQIIKMMQVQMAWPPLQAQQTGQWNPHLVPQSQPFLMK